MTSTSLAQPTDGIKDWINPIEHSSISYGAQRKSCSSNITGHTSRKLATRIKEHRSAISTPNGLALRVHRSQLWPKQRFNNKCIELPQAYSGLRWPMITVGWEIYSRHFFVKTTVLTTNYSTNLKAQHASHDQVPM